MPPCPTLVGNMCKKANTDDDLNADGGEGGHEEFVHVVEAGVALRGTGGYGG